jgi:HPt (histidine-containing phosphotransfer) domain-containing protein
MHRHEIRLADVETLGSVIREIWPLWRSEELARLEVLEHAADLGTGLSEAERSAARRESHRLAGTLAALGQRTATDAARELERRLRIGDLAELGPLVRSVKAALDAAPLGSAP